ncbi:hypothetical protein [Anaerobutyricum hallii]|uniref:hypothetical protein n=1 Tax=Anaerobutyricum hallii TaxID=39488 RepID=UPI001650DA7D|nr:hypothetical protein [Anaerobutyricum hallii]
MAVLCFLVLFAVQKTADLLRVDDSDGFIINDSNSRTNSKKRWSYEQLSRQMRNLWAMYN